MTNALSAGSSGVSRQGAVKGVFGSLFFEEEDAGF